MNGYIAPPEVASSASLPDEKAQLARITLLGHDLRAAVSDILGGLRMLGDESLSPPMRLQLERMRAAGEDMARLIEEGLEVVTEQTVMPLRQTVQLARMLYDIEMRWAGRAQEKGLGFHVALSPDVPMVVTLDRIALERVLANMLSNALKYTDRGDVRLFVTLDEAGLHFSVLDDGPGFAPELSPRLFRAGSRGDAPGKAGNGLGLYISRDMARRLGGDFEVGNRPEGGACVRLSLPLDGLLPPELRSETALPDLSRMRVLIAEDSALNQAVLGHMLCIMGARCDMANDGVEALERLDSGCYDLAVIDIEMPRVSGMELMTALRAGGGRHAGIPIVACTAYVLRANREAICEAGADAIVSKPFHGIEPLADAITQALAQAKDPKDCPARATLGAPVLDEAVFADLLELAGAAGAQELLERLLADLGRIERGLVAALSENDATRVRADSHVLISISGSVGAERLCALAVDLNAAADRGDLPAMQLLGRSALTQTDRLIHYAAKCLSQPRGGNART